MITYEIKIYILWHNRILTIETNLNYKCYSFVVICRSC